jgi:hypothetical protein
MLSVVTWLWGNLYTPSHIHKLKRGFERNYSKPFQFICLTDKEIDGIDCRAMPDRYLRFRAKQYRRLGLLDKDYAKTIGERILQLDIDTVFTDDVTDLFDATDPLKMWLCPSISSTGKTRNPSVMLFDWDYMHEVTLKFDTERPRPFRHDTKLYPGSDQAVINRYTVCRTWDEKDGLYSYRDHEQVRGHTLPDNCKMVGFYGAHDPKEASHLAWAKKHWI